MQGLIVFAVVISYEVVRVWGLRRQQKRVGEELAAAAAAAAGKSDNGDKTEKEVAAR
jgi:simple sugar transport system permease protein